MKECGGEKEERNLMTWGILTCHVHGWISTWYVFKRGKNICRTTCKALLRSVWIHMDYQRAAFLLEQTLLGIHIIYCGEGNDKK